MTHDELRQDHSPVAGFPSVPPAAFDRHLIGTEAALHLQGAALTAAANAILIADRSGAIVWVNPAFTSLTGYTLAEAVGKSPRDLVKSGRQEHAVYQDLWETILAGRVWRGELVNRRKDGSLYPEEQTITPVCGAGGAITHFIAIKQDLSARKRAEETLRQSEARYRLLFEDNPLAQWLVDPATLKFLAVNAAAVRLYGYSREEFLGMTIAQIRPEEDVPELLKLLADRPAGFQNTTESRHRRKDGSIIQVEIISRPMVFGGRNARLVIATDVTEKRLIEETLRHAQRVESIGLLAAGIAHDLNNVLAPIVFAAPMLREKLSDPGDLKVLDALERSAGRGAGLVRQILGFVRGNTGELRPIQVKHLAHDIAEVIDRSFPKSIRFEYSIPSDLWPVQANPTQIHQVILNLCVNARDAMPQGGTLGVKLCNRDLAEDEAHALTGARPAASAGAWLILEVSDTGTGIAPDILARIWEPFFTTKGRGQGTGLGLFTVCGIVASHHGFITLETQRGRGTTFRVYLPATPDAPVEVDRERMTEMPVGNSELVLVVDDDPAVRDLLTALLVKDNYRVLTASDGLEAVGIFTKHSDEIALVVTDVDMPNLSGAGLARILAWQRPDVRLLVVSGLSRQQTDGSGLAAARALSHGFLIKPFTPAALFGIVHDLLHPKPRDQFELSLAGGDGAMAQQSS